MEFDDRILLDRREEVVLLLWKSSVYRWRSGLNVAIEWEEAIPSCLAVEDVDLW